MTTLAIANQLVEFCRQGKNREAKALYADDAVSVEAFAPPGAEGFQLEGCVAWVNRDGSINLHFDSLPIGGKVHLREDKEREKHEGESEGARKPTAGGQRALES